MRPRCPDNAFIEFLFLGTRHPTASCAFFDVVGDERRRVNALRLRAAARSPVSTVTSSEPPQPSQRQRLFLRFLGGGLYRLRQERELVWIQLRIQIPHAPAAIEAAEFFAMRDKMLTTEGRQLAIIHAEIRRVPRIDVSRVDFQDASLVRPRADFLVQRRGFGYEEGDIAVALVRPVHHVPFRALESFDADKRLQGGLYEEIALRPLPIAIIMSRQNPSHFQFWPPGDQVLHHAVEVVARIQINEVQAPVHNGLRGLRGRLNETIPMVLASQPTHDLTTRQLHTLADDLSCCYTKHQGGRTTDAD